MKRNLPPLLALRAFEAAARHLSFSKAGEELNVTQAAISRQIKILETFLNHSLFNRLTRQVELTPFGRSYLAAATHALDTVEQATSEIMTQQRSLSISILPSIGSLWLMERMTGFACAYPEIKMHISSSMDPVDFKRHNIDLAIRVGKLPGQTYDPSLPQIDFKMVEDWTDVGAIHLWDDFVAPVCSPKLVEKLGPIESLEDLNRYCLIYNSRRPDCWSGWLRANGACAVTGSGRLEVSHSFIAAKAAREELGVACLSSIEIDPWSSSDKLVWPFAKQVQSAGAYYLLGLHERLAAPDTKLFHDWLVAQY